MVATMPSPLDTIAHLILPNIMKLKGASMLVGAMERRDASPFAHIWQQTGIEHTPQVVAKEKGDNRFGIMTMPTPTSAGEAHMVAFGAKKHHAAAPRFFTPQSRLTLSKQ